MNVHVAPNLLNSIGPWRRLPLLEDEKDPLAFEGLGMFRTYIPSNLGGVLEVGCNQDKAKIIINHPKPGDNLKNFVGQPIPPAKRVFYPVKIGQHGWFYIAIGNVSGVYQVWARFYEVAVARESEDETADPLVPWNFWYWPNAASRKELTAWGSDVLQPCQKYEAAFGRQGVFDWEKTNHNDPNGTAEGWFGHCHNSAPASMIFKPPPDDGKSFGGQSFLCEELKFFATEFFGRYGTLKVGWSLKETKPRQGPFQQNKPADKPRMFGTIIGEFHQALARQLLVDGSPVLMDLRDSSGSDHTAVWNQAVYRYAAQFYETTPHGDWRDIQVKTRLHANDDTMLEPDFRSSGLPAEIMVDDIRGAPRYKTAAPAKDAPNKPAIRRDQLLLYRLIFKEDGTIDTRNPKNEWTSNTYLHGVDGDSYGNELFAPRFMFTPGKVTASPNAQGSGQPDDGNPRLVRADVLSLLELRDRYK
jgi:hypothetical protein